MPDVSGSGIEVAIIQEAEVSYTSSGERDRQEFFSMGTEGFSKDKKEKAYLARETVECGKIWKLG
jgi:hypothetical protein